MINEAEGSDWKCFLLSDIDLADLMGKVCWSKRVYACRARMEHCYAVSVSSWYKLCRSSAYLLVAQWRMTARQWNGKTSSVCPSSQGSAPFLIKESPFSCSLQLGCGAQCHRMLLQAKNSARCKKKLNTNSNNIFFETEIQVVFQFWGQFTAFKG